MGTKPVYPQLTINIQNTKDFSNKTREVEWISYIILIQKQLLLRRK